MPFVGAHARMTHQPQMCMQQRVLKPDAYKQEFFKRFLAEIK